MENLFLGVHQYNKDGAHFFYKTEHESQCLQIIHRFHYEHVINTGIDDSRMMVSTMEKPPSIVILQ